MTFLVYFALYTCSICLAASAAKRSMKMGNNVWKHPSFYGLLIVFSFIVGTRYMVGLDYPSYMMIIQLGDQHHYYEHVEFIPRKIIDIVNALNLEFYWWFIFMAFAQIFFIAIAVKDKYRKVFPWIILCFFMFNMSFYLNVVRQGAALSCFVCACSFIKDRKLYHYLIAILIGFMFHKSIIIWLPMYWIVNKEFLKNIKIQYIIFLCSIIVLPILINKIVEIAMPILFAIGFENQATMVTEMQEGDISIGSGLGVVLRYLRWTTIIAYYNKLKEFIGKESFVPLYNLFFIGIILDAATMNIIYLNRMIMYGTILEIFIFAALLYYMAKTKNQMDRIIIFILLIPNFILYIILPLTTGMLKWHTIWDAPFTI